MKIGCMKNRVSVQFPVALMILIAVQAACAAFFVTDAVSDVLEDAVIDLHLTLEGVATLSLLGAIFLEGRFLSQLLRRKSRLERSLKDASAEVHAVIMGQFEAWSLSPAETDIALFLVKGMGTQDIAEIRGSAEGTIKAHFNAIFRKAGVHSRTELLSVLIDRLLGSRLDDEAVPTLRKSG